MDYIKHSVDIGFSLFHPHWKGGQDRACAFALDFLKEEHLENKGELFSAYSVLINFLNDSKNGNTHPHSYRTILLHTLLPEDQQKTFEYTSKHFNKWLQYLEVAWQCSPSSGKSPR